MITEKKRKNRIPRRKVIDFKILNKIISTQKYSIRNNKKNSRIDYSNLFED